MCLRYISAVDALLFLCLFSPLLSLYFSCGEGVLKFKILFALNATNINEKPITAIFKRKKISRTYNMAAPSTLFLF